jgi:hypothetical protein
MWKWSEQKPKPKFLTSWSRNRTKQDRLCNQCCGSGMISSRMRLNFIPDPGSRIPDPDPVSYYKIKKGKFLKLLPELFNSVAEPVHFCAAPAPACQKFRLRLQLVKNFGSGSDHFSHIFSKKIKNFHGLKKISCFLKPKIGSIK